MIMTEPLIKLTDVTRMYELGGEPLPALAGVSLSINHGEYVAIMGASGSGKSTMMNIVGCLDRPTSGEYLLEGKSIGECTEDELAEIRNSTVGFVFQQFNLLSRMTALENVMLPLTYAGVSREQRVLRAEYVLKQVGLGDRMHHRPSQLSGGQQQRVSVARALANHPRLVLADEPTGALDSHTAKEIMALLDELVAKGITVVLVTHDADVGNHADRIIRLRDGLIISDELNRKQEQILS
jgi:putative ABC transport system ATP-binding protein